jgi:hypothetical protein
VICESSPAAATTAAPTSPAEPAIKKCPRESCRMSHATKPLHRAHSPSKTTMGEGLLTTTG